VGWVFLFATTQPPILLLGFVALAGGVAGFALWSWRGRTWPFG